MKQKIGECSPSASLRGMNISETFRLPGASRSGDLTCAWRTCARCGENDRVISLFRIYVEHTGATPYAYCPVTWYLRVRGVAGRWLEAQPVCATGLQSRQQELPRASKAGNRTRTTYFQRLGNRTHNNGGGTGLAGIETGSVTYHIALEVQWSTARRWRTSSAFGVCEAACTDGPRRVNIL